MLFIPTLAGGIAAVCFLFFEGEGTALNGTAAFRES
jgi:hypothetical protein